MESGWAVCDWINCHGCTGCSDAGRAAERERCASIVRRPMVEAIKSCDMHVVGVLERVLKQIEEGASG